MQDNIQNEVKQMNDCKDCFYYEEQVISNHLIEYCTSKNCDYKENKQNERRSENTGNERSDTQED